MQFGGDKYTVYPRLNAPGGRSILQKICKKTSYYFVNFWLEKNNWGGPEGGRLIEGGGVKSGVNGSYIYLVHWDHELYVVYIH